MFKHKGLGISMPLKILLLTIFLKTPLKDNFASYQVDEIDSCFEIIQNIDLEDENFENELKIIDCIRKIEKVSLFDSNLDTTLYDSRSHNINSDSTTISIDQLNFFMDQKLCFKCHEMKKPATQFINGTHSSIRCGDCHVEGFIKDHVIKGTKELLVHVSGKYDFIENSDSISNDQQLIRANNNLLSLLKKLIHFKFNMFNNKIIGYGTIPENRLDELSEGVREHILLNNSSVCIRCHNFDNLTNNSYMLQNPIQHQRAPENKPVNAYGRKKHSNAIKNINRVIRNYLVDNNIKKELEDLTTNEKNLILIEFLKERNDLLSPIENEKITCLDCHPYPGHRK